MNTTVRLITLLTLAAAPGLATASETGGAIGGAGGAAGGSAVTDHDNDATGSTDCRSATVYRQNIAGQSSTTTKRTCD